MKRSRNSAQPKVVVAIVIAAMLSFLCTCAFRVDLCGAMPGHDSYAQSAADIDQSETDHHHAESDDGCSRSSPGESPHLKTCCSTWGVGEARYQLLAPSLLTMSAAAPTAAELVDAIQAAATGFRYFAPNRAAPSRPLQSILRL